MILLVLVTSACNEQKNYTQSDREQKNIKLETNHRADLPFVGKRAFETRHAVSGTGTPHRYVEILDNGDVYFSFEQENQADGTIMIERYYSGKFDKYLRCVFSKLDNETIYYEIAGDKIYELDSNSQHVTNEDCCTLSNIDSADKCLCEGILSSINAY